MARYRYMHPAKRMRKIIRELEQVIRDKRWWNQNRLDARPFDIGADLAALKLQREALAAFDRGDYVECQRLQDQMVETLDHPV